MATKAKPGDVTGRQRQEQAAAFEIEQQEAASQMSLATAQAKIAVDTEIIDATKPTPTVTVVDPVTEIVTDEEEDFVVVRILENIESMTWGPGNFHSFRAGSRVKMRKDMARHLASRGFIQDID